VQLDRADLIAAKVYGPNTERVLTWLDDLQILTGDIWRRIQARALTAPAAFATAAHIVETSIPLQAGMLRVAADTGLAVATAGLNQSEAAPLLVATRNAGLAILTLDLIPGEAFIELYRPFQEALPQDPIRQRMQRLLRASGDAAETIVDFRNAEAASLVVAEFFAAGLAEMTRIGKAANGLEWAQLFLSGCMGVCGGLAAFDHNQPADYELWFRDAATHGLQVYVLGPSAKPGSLPRDFKDRVKKITDGRVRDADKALAQFEHRLKNLGLLDL
jgi:hypothetical protein